MPKKTGCACKQQALDEQKAAAEKATVGAAELGKRKRAAPRRFVPPQIHHADTGKSKRALVHDDECFSCTDGGDLLEVGKCWWHMCSMPTPPADTKWS